MVHASDELPNQLLDKLSQIRLINTLVLFLILCASVALFLSLICYSVYYSGMYIILCLYYMHAGSICLCWYLVEHYCQLITSAILTWYPKER